MGLSTAAAILASSLNVADLPPTSNHEALQAPNPLAIVYTDETAQRINQTCVGEYSQHRRLIRELVKNPNLAASQSEVLNRFRVTLENKLAEQRLAVMQAKLNAMLENPEITESEFYNFFTLNPLAAWIIPSEFRRSLKTENTLKPGLLEDLDPDHSDKPASDWRAHARSNVMAFINTAIEEAKSADPEFNEAKTNVKRMMQQSPTFNDFQITTLLCALENNRPSGTVKAAKETVEEIFYTYQPQFEVLGITVEDLSQMLKDANGDLREWLQELQATILE